MGNELGCSTPTPLYVVFFFKIPVAAIYATTPNLALVSSLVSFALSRILTPEQFHIRNQSITALNAAQWGINAYLYAPLAYHGLKVIPEIWNTYQATKTYEKKIDFVHKQITNHPKAPKLPPASMKAIAILLATIY